MLASFEPSTLFIRMHREFRALEPTPTHRDQWLCGGVVQVFEVSKEMLNFYERLRTPIDTPTCQRLLEVLGLPAVLHSSTSQQAQHELGQQAQQAQG